MTVTTFAEALAAGRTSTDGALEIFDSLECVDAPFMLGSWKGQGFPTSHPLDGVLECYHWYGKRFESVEHAHPLVFTNMAGGTTSLNPVFFRPIISVLDRLPLPKSRNLGRMFQAGMFLLAAGRSHARLRMTHYRDRTTATMVYDDLPIIDVFRKVDENTVLGLTDLKGMRQPFFFVLHRERRTD